MRTGKIAKLPGKVRTELNERMADGEDGTTLLPWLNGLPEVKKVLAKHFAGQEISKQNLSDWRLGGFVEWEATNALLAQSERMKSEVGALASVANKGQAFGDMLALSLEARFVEMVRSAPGACGRPSQGKEEHEKEDETYDVRLKRMDLLSVAVNRMRRADHARERLGLAQEKWAFKQVEERKRAKEELLEAAKEHPIVQEFFEHGYEVLEHLENGNDSDYSLDDLWEMVEKAQDVEKVEERKPRLCFGGPYHVVYDKDTMRPPMAGEGSCKWLIPEEVAGAVARYRLRKDHGYEDPFEEGGVFAEGYVLADGHHEEAPITNVQAPSAFAELRRDLREDGGSRMEDGGERVQTSNSEQPTPNIQSEAVEQPRHEGTKEESGTEVSETTARQEPRPTLEGEEDGQSKMEDGEAHGTTAAEAMTEKVARPTQGIVRPYGIAEERREAGEPLEPAPEGTCEELRNDPNWRPTEEWFREQERRRIEELVSQMPEEVQRAREERLEQQRRQQKEEERWRTE